MTYSPEQVFPAEYNENQDVESLDLNNLKVGHHVFLILEDGRAYWLRIDRREDGGDVFGKARFGRKSQFAKEIEDWQELPHRLQFRGSCEKFEPAEGDFVVVGDKPGVFEAGKRAWFSFVTEKGEGKMATQTIKTIRLLNEPSEAEITMGTVENSDTIDSR